MSPAQQHRKTAKLSRFGRRSRLQIGNASCSLGASEVPMSNRPDRRCANRVAIEYAARVGVGSVETHAVSVNVSADGIALRSNLHWPAGERVTLKLHLPDATCVAAYATVTRSEG